MDFDSSVFFSAQSSKDFVNSFTLTKAALNREDDSACWHQSTNNNYSIPTGFHTCWMQALTVRNSDVGNPRDKLSSSIQANRSVKAATPAHSHQRRQQKQR